MRYSVHLGAVAALVVSLQVVTERAYSTTFFYRQSVFWIDPSAGLSNATTAYENKIYLPIGGDSAPGLTISLKTGAYSQYFNVDPGLTTTFVPAASGATSQTGDITNHSGGYFRFGYTTNNGPDFSASWTQSEIVGGRQALHFFGGGTTFLDAGGTFDDWIAIKGDWSAASAHHLNGIDSAWAIHGYDFYFDGTYTYLFAQNANFDPVAAPSANIDFYLFGDSVAAVPEPSTWA